MKKDKKLLPFDNLLSAYFTGRDQQLNDALVDREVESIFSQPIEVSLPKGKVQLLISSLNNKLSVDTLGSIVTKGLDSTAIDLNQVQEKTGLTPSMLNAIKKDMVFTNSIPVRSLIKLLKFLGVSVEKSLAAIDVTFDKLQTESKAFLVVPVNIQPAFRKGMVHSELSKDQGYLKMDESYLYQNKEALNKYTARFAELYQIL